MLEFIEYVDPAKSKCEECGCSFGVHLRTCSKFVHPRAAKSTKNKEDSIANLLAQYGGHISRAACSNLMAATWDAAMDGLPANWWDNSSLEVWFPLTAEELKCKKAELAAAWNEIQCCDDVRLDQGLAVAIADLQKLRVAAEKTLTQLSCGKVENKP